LLLDVKNLKQRKEKGVLEAVPRVSFVVPPPDGVVVGVPEIAIPAAASAAAVAASATFAQGVVGACQRSRAR